LSILAILGGKRAVSSRFQAWPEDYLRKYGRDEARAIARISRSGRLAAPSPTTNPFEPYPVLEAGKFEREFATHVGVKHARLVASGTAALHCALAGAGVRPGDEVITTPHTYISTATSILLQGAVPRFVDIDDRTFNIDPSKIETAITKSTRAILPVHIYGLVANMSQVQRIAKKHNLAIVEDACQSHGAEYNSQKAGSFGRLSAFSLNSTKNMAAGEGGVYVTNDTNSLLRSETVRLFGEVFDPKVSRARNISELGNNYRTTELIAAVARVQLRKLSRTNADRVRNANYLKKKLAKIDGIVPPFVPSGYKHVFHMFKIRIDSTKFDYRISPRELRNKIVSALVAEGVPASVWCCRPIYLQPLFSPNARGSQWLHPKFVELRMRAEFQRGLCPLAERVSDESFNLTVHPPNSLETMEEYVEAFEKVVANVDELKRVRGEMTEIERGLMTVAA